MRARLLGHCREKGQSQQLQILNCQCEGHAKKLARPRHCPAVTDGCSHLAWKALIAVQTSLWQKGRGRNQAI